MITTNMTIEEMTAEEAIEALEDLYEAIPKLIFLIKLNQHRAPVEADAVDVELTAPDPTSTPDYR